MIQAYYTEARQRHFLSILPDLVRSRALLRDLVWKELHARYRNAMMGFLWALLQPLMMMAILTLVFGYLFAGMVKGRGIETEQPYAIMLLSGLVFWQFLAMAVMRGTTSLLEDQELIKKVYFPREVIPVASVIYSLVNVVIGFLTLLAAMALLMPRGAASIGVGVLYVPGIFAIEFVLVLGLALLFSAINLRYNDIAYMVEVALSFGFYATPIIYPMSFHTVQKSALFRTFLDINPMTHIMMGYQNTVFYGTMIHWKKLGVTFLVSIILLLIGAYVFDKLRDSFPEEV